MVDLSKYIECRHAATGAKSKRVFLIKKEDLLIVLARRRHQKVEIRELYFRKDEKDEQIPFSIGSAFNEDVEYIHPKEVYNITNEMFVGAFNAGL